MEPRHQKRWLVSGECRSPIKNTARGAWRYSGFRAEYFPAPPPSVGGLDLDSRNSGCARLGGEVGLIYHSAQRNPPDDELELELILSQMAQKPMLRGEVGARALRVRSDVRNPPDDGPPSLLGIYWVEG